MEIINKKIEELKPYEKNPRKNENAIEYVAESIKQFGFKVPIVITNDGTIITGHTRYEASKRLGLKEVPCIKADDLTDEQVKAFRLADNKVSEFADWDFELLLEELEDIDEIDMSILGFDSNMDIDWASVDDLSDSTYEQPVKDMLECPHCHHIDSKIHFKKVDGLDVAEELAEEEQ